MQTKIQENSKTLKENAKIRFSFFLFIIFYFLLIQRAPQIEMFQEALLLKKERKKQTKTKNC